MTDSAPPPSIVWHKRDLRVFDHAPLVEALRHGRVVPVFILENELLQSPEFDGSHLEFLTQSLVSLRRAYRERGGELLIRRGEAVAVLEDLRRQTGARRLFSHEETGNAITYARDLRVGRWARAIGVQWTELPQTGVVRRLRDRNGWSRNWAQRMESPRLAAPPVVAVPAGLVAGDIPSHDDLGVAPNTKAPIQAGGRLAAEGTLEDFLSARGIDYSKKLSSPVTAPDACSRLSVYLAFGCLSLREVYQASASRRAALRVEGGPEAGRWLRSLSAFEGRLHWHCHFMQKLESQPELEFENIHRACDGLRESEFDEERFARWCEGRTGYPMVDACMRSLLAAGWLNFRMRAMLVSFASYNLWLHWRRPAVFMARHFLDFEAGIHFPQFQMQSGTTGINTLRIYSPTKQALDHDPQGTFIRRWVPELEGVPTALLAEPWKLDAQDRARFGCDRYPAPCVDWSESTRRAKERLRAVRTQDAARGESRAIAARHGSRRRPSARGARPSEESQAQLVLDFDGAGDDGLQE